MDPQKTTRCGIASLPTGVGFLFEFVLALFMGYPPHPPSGTAGRRLPGSATGRAAWPDPGPCARPSDRTSHTRPDHICFCNAPTSFGTAAPSSGTDTGFCHTAGFDEPSVPADTPDPHPLRFFHTGCGAVFPQRRGGSSTACAMSSISSGENHLFNALSSRRRFPESRWCFLPAPFQPDIVV